MKILALPLLLLTLALGGCASGPVDDPGGNWARQAETFDGSLFND